MKTIEREARNVVDSSALVYSFSTFFSLLSTADKSVRLSRLMEGASVKRFHLETVSWHRAPIMRDKVCIPWPPMSDRALAHAAAAAAAVHIVGVWKTVVLRADVLLALAERDSLLWDERTWGLRRVLCLRVEGV